MRPLRSLLILSLLLTFGTAGCATIRVTDPTRTATEQFLLSEASRRAVDQLSAETLRDRKIFVDTSYLVTSAFPTPENLYMVAEVRSKLLLSGVRLVPRREESQIVLEVRSGGIGIDRLEYLLGIPSVYLSNLGNNNVSSSAAAAGLSTPELAIVKNTKQKGYAGVAFVAYWSDTGEVVSSSGPFVGRTLRDDWWFFGFGPKTIGDIPPAEK